MRNRILAALTVACLPACLLISPLDEATPDWGYGGNGGSSGGGAGQGSGGSSGSSSETSGGMGPTAGSGGSSGGGGPHACDDPLMIDDFEAPTHESSPCATDGRTGGWYIYTDGTGTTTPPASPTAPPFPYSALDVPRDGSTYGLHVTASGQTVYGGGLGFSMHFPAQPYDARAYSGISFWARGQGSFRVAFVTTETRAADLEGGECVATSVDCNDHFGTLVFNLTSSWQEYTIRFAELEQQGWGVPALSLLSSQLLGIEFAWTLDDFDFWMDDLQFLPADCTDYETHACPSASSINFCSYGASTTYDCADLCPKRGFQGGDTCDTTSGCDCGATLDAECETGAVFVCECLATGGTTCTPEDLYLEYYGCYRGVPTWDYVRCMAPYAESGTTACTDAITACLD